VAGVPARLLRVGFVGELGYEIHVAASDAVQLWRLLHAAGLPRGARLSESRRSVCCGSRKPISSWARIRTA